MSKLTALVVAELAEMGLRLATDEDRVSWLEETCIGLVAATEDTESPVIVDLADFTHDWNRAAAVQRSRSTKPAITAEIVYDTWRDTNGRQRVAAMIAPLPPRERNAIEVGYWNLLRKRHYPAPSLVEVRIAFDLALVWDAA